MTYPVERGGGGRGGREGEAMIAIAGKWVGRGEGLDGATFTKVVGNSVK